MKLSVPIVADLSRSPMRIIGATDITALCSANSPPKPTTSTTKGLPMQTKQHQLPFNLAWIDHLHRKHRKAFHELQLQAQHTPVATRDSSKDNLPKETHATLGKCGVSNGH